jgi:hypothetical protein
LKNFRFRKTIKRNNFTKIFGGIGCKRFVSTYVKRGRIERIVERLCWNKMPRFKIQKMRRAHQGWRNRVFGMITALNIRKKYGRRRPAAQLRR